MKRSLIIVLLVFTNLVTAQIKIGDNPQTLDTSSLLELESSSKALVISRVSEAEMLAITPLQGAIVYNTDASCIFYYDGTTWNNLCGDTSTGGIAWGDITGDITTQTDLAQNYVDRSTLQANIAGEKTFINKLTVNTGTLSDQAAEFFGRVKGENGTEDEDFVTLAQLNASGGGGTWGSITGDITTQTDLATEFLKYVDLTTAQSIAGEKTLTNKLTVNTGTLTDQVAEFFGRVKGENGTAPEDFVTLAQLNTSGGGGTWGSITGVLTDQLDLTAEFQNYVDLTNVQTIAGEKTLTNKLTVDTGNITAQSAEFFGRVKGENGTEDEDFVTKQQLDAVTAGALTGTPGSIFFADTDTQPTENNANLFWDNTNNQLRIGSNSPMVGTTNSAVHIQGSISKPIHNDLNVLTEEHHTTVLNYNTFITLPDPATCYGRIYIIKLGPTATDVGIASFRDNEYNFVNKFKSGPGVTQLQSNGQWWEQIN